MGALGKFSVVAVKSALLCLLVWPFSYLLDLLANPRAALVSVFALNSLLAVYSIVSMSNSATGAHDKALVIPMLPSIAMTTTLIGYYIGAVNASVFVIIAAIFGVVCIEGIVTQPPSCLRLLKWYH